MFYLDLSPFPFYVFYQIVSYHSDGKVLNPDDVDDNPDVQGDPDDPVWQEVWDA